MKYLVVVQLSSGAGNAEIFNTQEEAREHLSEIASTLKYPIKVEWEDDNTLYAKITQSDWVRIRIAKANRAEYRLVRHKSGEKDEERRFFVRKNAIKYVADNYEDPSNTQNNLGEWMKNSKNKYSYKLYATILDSEKGSHTVLKRFDAAISQCVLFDDVKEYFEDTTNLENANEETVVIEKKPESRLKHIVKKAHRRGKKKIYPVIFALAAIIIAIVLVSLDWQLLADESKARNFKASEEVKTLSEALHFTRKGKAAFFASQPRLLGSTEFNKTCGRDGKETFTSGCYYKDSHDDERIDIYNVGTSTISENGLTYDFGAYRKSVALHETLHAVWERLDEKKKATACGDLKVLSNQISALKTEVSLYNNSQLCTELFARVGSEYASILSPKNNIPASTTVPIRYSSLDINGKNAISNLIKIYDNYFDTTNYTWITSYWQNEKQLDAFETKVINYARQVENKEQSTRTLINQYYWWPTWGRYYTAINAIDEYNNMVNIYNSYINTYNKVYSKLDSERTMSAGGYLSL